MVACGRAIFDVGTEREVVEFSTIAELREKEDELTWKHWPAELVLVSVDYTPTKTTTEKKVA